MARKKDEKDIREAKTAPEEQNTAQKNEAADKAKDAPAEGDMPVEETIPEEVTLTKAEFMKVKARIDTLEKEKSDNVALLQRLQADFDNYRKRNATISADSVDEGTRNLIKALLPVMDDLDRALDAAPEGKDAGWIDGVKMVRTKFLDTLKKNGLEEIEAKGQFDPELHNAVLQEDKEGAESGDIIEVLQKGYKVKNRIIRHTMVKVAK